VGALAGGQPPALDQAIAATLAGGVTGAVCGVSLGAACIATGAATSVGQYLEAPGKKTWAGAIKSAVLGGATAFFGGGGIFPEQAAVTFTEQQYANAARRFLMNHQTSFGQVIDAAWSNFWKGFGGSVISGAGPQIQLP
jgi:hypothetical protein